jgi:hypothetical protein
MSRKTYQHMVLDAWMNRVSREARDYLHALFFSPRAGYRPTLALDVLDEEPKRLMALFSCLRLRNAIDWEPSGIEELTIDVADVLAEVSEDDLIFAAFGEWEYARNEWPQDEASEFAEDMVQGVTA